MLKDMGFLLKIAGLLLGFTLGNEAGGIAGGFVGGILGLVVGYLVDELWLKSRGSRKRAAVDQSRRELHLAMFRQRNGREPRSDSEFADFLDEIEDRD